MRAGKAFRFDIAAADEAAALAQATVVADRLLANPVIEESAVTVSPAGGGSTGRRLMAARVGVVIFPGTNCEHDAVLAVRRLGASAELVWHGDTHGGRLRRPGPARRLRPRRLPPARGHRPLLAGDGGGGPRSPPTAGRWSGSATASRC